MQRKIEESLARLKELEERPLRPKMNKKVASAFVRNALFDVNDSSEGATVSVFCTVV